MLSDMCTEKMLSSMELQHWPNNQRMMFSILEVVESENFSRFESILLFRWIMIMDRDIVSLIEIEMSTMLLMK